MKKPINISVHELLQEMSSQTSPRGLKVIEKELTTLELDPLYPIINFNSRKFNWKYFVGELWWYLSKETKIDKIKNFSGFWNGLLDNGTVNSNYGYIMLSRQKNQFSWALSRLILDKDSRQAVMVFNTPAYQKYGVKDFVCTMYVNLWIRDSKLNMKVQMRSNDIFYGLQYDAPFFSLIQQSALHTLKRYYSDLELGTYYHCSDNTHYYERHFDMVEKIKNEDPNNENNTVKLEINCPIFDVNDGLTDDSHSFMEHMSSINDFSSLNDDDYKAIFTKFFMEK
jgi:thymidylate synthase